MTEPSTSSYDANATLVQDEAHLDLSRDLSRQSERAPAVVPGFTISRSLGSGAYGSVWLAREQNTGKQVAIKFYTHRRGVDWALLHREVEKLAVLYTSRNIIGLLDVGWDSDPPYYVMEYLERGSLSSYLSAGPLPVPEAVRITGSVLHALVHAHGCGILHCDLKPANVLLDADFEPRLCDFGQSRLSDETYPSLGTLFYMAPEQADLQAVPDARWDVYALGALLYHMLTGAPPHRTPENEAKLAKAEGLEERLTVYRKILKAGPKPSAHRKLRGVDGRLAEIVDRCLHVHPERRYPNAQAVLDALELRDRQRRRRTLMALGVLAPLLLLIAMIPFARNAIASTVATATELLTARALESDVLSANALAEMINRELENRTLEMERLTTSRSLRDAVLTTANQTWEQRETAFQQLLEHKQEIDAARAERDRPRDASWFVTDRNGIQLWRDPPDQSTIGHKFSHRDYFHGLNREFPPESVPDNIEPIRTAHVSLAFRSEATKQLMVAISVPIWNEERTEVLGVLARTTHVVQLREDLMSGINAWESARETEKIDRHVVLAERSEQNEWKLLDHPWLAEEQVKKLSNADFAAMLRRSALTEQDARRLNFLDAAPHNGQFQGNDRNPEYRDPATQFSEEAAQHFEGVWLAAFWPVANTRWAVIVQERKPSALAPIDGIQRAMIDYGLQALVAGGALVIGLWYFVNRAISERTYTLTGLRGPGGTATETETSGGTSLSQR